MRTVCYILPLLIAVALGISSAEAQARTDIYGFSGGSGGGVYGLRISSNIRSFGVRGSGLSRQFGVSRNRNFYGMSSHNNLSAMIGGRSHMGHLSGVGRATGRLSGVSRGGNSFRVGRNYFR